MKKLSPLNYALYLLKLRDRSVGEIKKKMREHKFNESEIEEIVQFLIEKKFLDDEKFANNYIRNQLLLKPQGKYRLEMKLKQLLVPEEIIKKVLQSITENSEKEQARELAERWIVKHHSLSYEGRDKLARFLCSRGFSWDVVKEAIDSINFNSRL